MVPATSSLYCPPGDVVPLRSHQRGPILMDVVRVQHTADVELVLLQPNPRQPDADPAVGGYAHPLRPAGPDGQRLGVPGSQEAAGDGVVAGRIPSYHIVLSLP